MEYKFTEGYQNWIKCTLALAHLREGLAPPVTDAMHRDYAVFVLRITQKCKISRYSCTSCTTSKLIPAHKPTSCKYRKRELCNCSTGTTKCPQSGACGEFYDYIVSAHACDSPFWNNCDFQKISQNIWHFAKCFISGSGKNNIECSDDMDSADMISICLNYRKLRDQFSTVDVLKKARMVRNHILHSGKMELTKDEVNAYIDDLSAVLKEKPCQETHHNANGYIIKLERLKNETIVISTKASVCAHRDAVKAVLEEIQILHKMADKVESGDDSGAVIAEEEGESQLTLEEINERLDTLCALEKIHKDMLEKHKEQCEEIKSILDDCSRNIRMLQNTADAIEKITTETNEGVKIIQDDMQEIKKTLADIQKYCVPGNVPIPGIRMEIVSSNIPTTKEKNFQVILVGANTIPDEAWKEVKQSYKKFQDEMSCENGENKREVTDTKHECLAVYVQCWTPKAILKLCEDCVSGRLTEMLKPVERKLRQIEGYEFVTLEVVIYRKDFIQSIDLLVRRLKWYFENMPRTEESISTNRNGLTPTDIAPLLQAIEVATKESSTSNKANVRSEIYGIDQGFVLRRPDVVTLPDLEELPEGFLTSADLEISEGTPEEETLPDLEELPEGFLTSADLEISEGTPEEETLPDLEELPGGFLAYLEISVGTPEEERLLNKSSIHDFELGSDECSGSGSDIDSDSSLNYPSGMF